MEKFITLKTILEKGKTLLLIREDLKEQEQMSEEEIAKETQQMTEWVASLSQSGHLPTVTDY